MLVTFRLKDFYNEFIINNIFKNNFVWLRVGRSVYQLLEILQTDPYMLMKGSVEKYFKIYVEDWAPGTAAVNKILFKNYFFKFNKKIF